MEQGMRAFTRREPGYTWCMVRKHDRGGQPSWKTANQSVSPGPLCPGCGQPLAEILYGLPSGSPPPGVVLGGCILREDTHVCERCNRWFVRSADGALTESTDA